MLIKYQIFKEKNLLIQKYYGNWSLKHYKDFFMAFMKDPDFKYVEKVLTDFTEVDLITAYKELDDLIAFRVKHIKNKYFNVHLINNSSNTAIIHLYQQQLQNRGYEYEYCSTLEKALILLNLPFSSFEMDAMLNNLSLEFKL